MSDKAESPKRYSRGVKSGLHEELRDSLIQSIPLWLPERYRKAENTEDQAKKEPKPSDNE